MQIPFRIENYCMCGPDGALEIDPSSFVVGKCVCAPAKPMIQMARFAQTHSDGLYDA